MNIKKIFQKEREAEKLDANAEERKEKWIRWLIGGGVVREENNRLIMTKGISLNYLIERLWILGEKDKKVLNVIRKRINHQE